MRDPPMPVSRPGNACDDRAMILGPEGMRDLQSRADSLNEEARNRQWKPGRLDRKALAMLSRAEGTVISRDAIIEMLNEMGARRMCQMDARLVTLVMDSAAAQDLESVAELPEAEEALRAVAGLVRSLARPRA